MNVGAAANVAGIETFVYDGHIPMVDLTRIEGFDWDDGNSRKSGDKHGVSQAEAELVFLTEPLLLSEDVKHSIEEPRLHALGQTDERRLLHIRGKGEI